MCTRMSRLVICRKITKDDQETSKGCFRDGGYPLDVVWKVVWKIAFVNGGVVTSDNRMESLFINKLNH